MAVKNEQILEAILQLKDIVSENNAQFREFRGKQTAEVESVKAEVAELEDDAKSDRRWSKVYTICVLPVVGILHQIAAHFHWIR